MPDSENEKTDPMAAARAAKAAKKAAEAAPLEATASVLQPVEIDAKPMFTAEEIAIIRENARKSVHAELRREEQAKLLAQFEDEARIEAGITPKQGPLEKPDDTKYEIEINLPPFSSEIVLDGRRFQQGRKYPVSKHVYLTLVDQMQHSWWHEDEKQGIGRHNTTLRQRNTQIRHGTVINDSRSMRA